MNRSMGQQKGVALIVSLVILIIVTLAGVATMESTGMQLRMANASQDRQQAFEATEAGLRVVEEMISDNTDAVADFDSMYLDCAGPDCFTADCTGGRCFQGIWRDGETVNQCKTVDNAAIAGGVVTVDPPLTNAWETGGDATFLNVWDDAADHLTLDLADFDNDVRYIIEFRCFGPADPEVALSDTNFAQLYRITARGMSDSGRVEVMLQSTYKRID